MEKDEDDEIIEIPEEEWKNVEDDETPEKSSKSNFFAVIMCIFLGLFVSILYAYTDIKDLEKRGEFVSTVWTTYFAKVVVCVIVTVFAFFICLVSGVFFLIKSITFCYAFLFSYFFINLLSFLRCLNW